MSIVGRWITAVVALLMVGASDAPAQDRATLVALRRDSGAAPGQVNMLCAPHALSLACSGTNVRVAVTPGVSGRSQTLTISPSQAYIVPRGRTLAGFDIQITTDLSRSAGGRLLLVAGIGGEAWSLDLSNRVQVGYGATSTIRLAMDAGFTSETVDEFGATVIRLPMHLALTAQTRSALDTARLQIVGVELIPVFRD